MRLITMTVVFSVGLLGGAVGYRAYLLDKTTINNLYKIETPDPSVLCWPDEFTGFDTQGRTKCEKKGNLINPLARNRMFGL